MNNTTTVSFSTASFGKVTARFESYTNGGTMAVEIYDEEDDFVTMLSVNLPEFQSELASNEFFAKIWSENEEIARDALASGVFKDTGRRVGFINAPVWKLHATKDLSEGQF